MINFEKIHTDVALALFTTPDQIAMDDNLADMGLDSMRIMSLVTQWQEEGMELDFIAFAETLTLAAWKAAFETQHRE
jgi:aryl carrier-like protein